MNKDLEKLIQLQEIDLRISEIRKSKQEFPLTVETLGAAIIKAEQDMKNSEARVSELNTEKKGLQEKSADAEEALKKSEERLNSIKTNREYDAVHAEIETNKRTKESSLTRAAGMDKDIEARQAASEEAKKMYEKVKADNEPVIAELKEKIATIDSKIAEVQKERNALLPQISKPAIRSYEYILKKRPNAQIISRVDAKKKVCGVCHKVLESQLLNEIKKGEKILNCQSCGSIFVFDAPAPQPGEQAPKAEEPAPGI